MVSYGQTRHVFVYDWEEPDATKCFAPLAHQPYSLFFDGNRPGHPLSRYSYLCWHPFETIESKDGRVTVSNMENHFTYAADVFQVVRERLSLWAEQIKSPKSFPFFHGGAAGFFGYDLARGIEKLPSNKTSSSPDLCIGLYNKVLVFDHHKNTASLMIHAVNEDEAQSHKKNLESWIKSHKEKPNINTSDIDWHTDVSDDYFLKNIQKVINYIYAGDIFQANLSRRFSTTRPKNFDPYHHYLCLRLCNPAPFSAYMNFGGMILSSSSPERFLKIRDRVVETRPIKGTLSDSNPPDLLLNSEKDRAENIMIVDLLRNDLSKCCEDHSVIVTKLCDVETFEGMHHMVSTVQGKLRGDQSATDVLRACFPGGSITGAPKIRAMEIIDELELDNRGPYCGAMGWIGFDGSMDTAITIRTLVYEGKNIHLQTGSGITALSDPLLEMAEMSLKAQKIRMSFLSTSTENNDERQKDAA